MPFKILIKQKFSGSTREYGIYEDVKRAISEADLAILEGEADSYTVINAETGVAVCTSRRL
jgi:hypothetical protein